MEYTKGEWKYKRVNQDNWIICNHIGYECVIAEMTVNIPEMEANAQLIAAAPLGYELAEFVSRVSATWIDEGLLEIGEGDYSRMKKLALEILTKVEGK